MNDKNNIKDIISYTSNLLNEFSINYWIDFDLLNCIIEKNEISSGNSFGMFLDDFPKLLNLCHRVYEDGFYLTSCFEDNFNKIKIHYSHKNLLNLEIKGWVKNRNLFVNNLSKIDKKVSFPDSFVKSFKKIEYDNISFTCTENVQDFYNFRNLEI